MFSSISFAAPPTDIPGPAEAGRLQQREERENKAPAPALEEAVPMRVIPFSAEAPKGSEKIIVTLKEVHIDGMTAFTEQQMADIYAPYLGQRIGLNTLWIIAGRMTERYQSAGYFLSRVVLPQQEATKGIITFRAIEGHIEEIDTPAELQSFDVVKAWLARLKSYRPIKASQLESVILQLNDLPGVQLHAVLQPSTDQAVAADGGVKLKLENTDQGDVHGSIQFDNYGSRYLGPYETTLRTQFEAIPLERTSITALSALPYDEMHYAGIAHQIPLFPGGSVSLLASTTVSAPGYLLKESEVRSNSTELGAAFDYQWIRQRDENLNLRFSVAGRKVNTDILDTPQTRDDIRIARLGGNYEWRDHLEGQNLINMTLSQGLNIFGSSESGDPNLSRSEAKPDFTKFEVYLRREQPFLENWSAVVAANMQAASGPLYASEEMGYGGQQFGRAYDDSEITGDHGIAGSLELRYQGLPDWKGMATQLYGFYDAGIVWNDDNTQTPRATGSSAGGGVRMLIDKGVSADLGLAFPLTRDIAAPLDGDKDGPRIMLQMGYSF